MGEQVFDRDGARWLDEHGLVFGFLLQQHLAFELGQVFGYWIVNAQLALILQHHDGERGDGLGHGGDPEETVFLHRCPGFQILKSDSLVTEQPAIFPDERDRTRELSVLDEGLLARRNG